MRFPIVLSRVVNLSRLHAAVPGSGNKLICTSSQTSTSPRLLLSFDFIYPSQLPVRRINNIHSASRCFHLTANPICKKSRSTKNLPVQDDVNEEKEEDPDDISDLIGKGDQVLRLRLATDRLDAVLKAGFNLSRNKIEKAIYGDRVRVNGDRPKKKSQVVSEGDEVDLVRRYNATNPSFLDVSRLEILEMGQYIRFREDDDDDDAKIPAKVKRYKNLTIENYRVPVKGNLNEE